MLAKLPNLLPIDNLVSAFSGRRRCRRRFGGVRVPPLDARLRGDRQHLRGRARHLHRQPRRALVALHILPKLVLAFRLTGLSLAF